MKLRHWHKDHDQLAAWLPKILKAIAVGATKGFQQKEGPTRDLSGHSKTSRRFVDSSVHWPALVGDGYAALSLLSGLL